MTALPLLHADNTPFWTGGEQGQLLIMRCTACAAWLHPPVPVCRHCLSTEVAPVPVSGRGVILSWTVNRQQWTPDLAVPFANVVVRLDEDPMLRVFSRMVEIDPDEVRTGMRVEVRFEQHEDVWLPLFAPEGAAA